MSWKPDNWEEIVKANVSRIGGFFNQDKPVIIEDDRLLFEAGADAMLGALEGSGIRMENYNPINRTVAETAWFLNQCKDGVLIFIPDEEAE